MVRVETIETVKKKKKKKTVLRLSSKQAVQAVMLKQPEMTQYQTVTTCCSKPGPEPRDETLSCIWTAKTEDAKSLFLLLIQCEN